MGTPRRYQRRLQHVSRIAAGATGTPPLGPQRYLPLYEAKMIHHFDPQWATYQPDGTVRSVTRDEKCDVGFDVMPRYWVAVEEVRRELEPWSEAWMFGWRDVCRSTDRRTCIACELPIVAAGDKILLAFSIHPLARLAFPFVMSSFAFDFVARQKVGGTALKYFTMRQLAFPSPGQLARALVGGVPWEQWVRPRLAGARSGDVLARAELDAAMFKIMGLTRTETCHALDTFEVQCRKEEREEGEYRTKRLIVDSYDAITVSRSD